MENTAVLTLASLCLGVALSGLLSTALRRGQKRARISLGLVYFSFTVMIALPLVQTFADSALINYMPVLLVALLALPPVFYHYIAALTLSDQRANFPLRDIWLPTAGALVCIGYWLLPSQAKTMMFIDGDLPTGFLPSALALLTFVLIIFWLVASFAYLIAILHNMTRYRARLRQLYSDADEHDLRWVDVLMALIALIWAVGAAFLADENFATQDLFVAEIFLALIGCGLLVLNIFAPLQPIDTEMVEPEHDVDPKYARSAMTADHASKLAARIDTAMKQDALYLDPCLSLQKLSQHVGALPNQVSQTLNQSIGANFFDYVAKWRIEASKPLIIAGEVSVLDVALEVGFNSRSTFYKAFSRETGLTPKGFRALHRVDASTK